MHSGCTRACNIVPTHTCRKADSNVLWTSWLVIGHTAREVMSFGVENSLRLKEFFNNSISWYPRGILATIIKSPQGINLTGCKERLRAATWRHGNWDSQLYFAQIQAFQTEQHVGDPIQQLQFRLAQRMIHSCCSLDQGLLHRFLSNTGPSPRS